MEENSISQPSTHHIHSLARIAIMILIGSLACGAAGGYYGAWLFNKRSEGVDRQPRYSAGMAIANDDVVDVVKRATPAVVSIIAKRDANELRAQNFDPFQFFFNGQAIPKTSPSEPDLQQVSAGTGFFVTADGLLLTNKHVVSDEKAVYSVLLSDGRTFDAKVVARDTVNDLAIVKADVSGVASLNLAETPVVLGASVIAIGNSLGEYQNTVTTGVVSGIGRRITAGGPDGSEQLDGVIQTDAAINPGNSGGPLLNRSGEVVGINTAVDRNGQSVGFAIPAMDAKQVLVSYQKSGRIIRPYLGIRYTLLNPEIVKERKVSVNDGALVISGSTAPAVIPDSPAAQAGIKEGDVITKVNGDVVSQSQSLAVLMRKFTAGDVVTMTIWRDGSDREVKVTLGERK